MDYVSTWRHLINGPWNCEHKVPRTRSHTLRTLMLNQTRAPPLANVYTARQLELREISALYSVGRQIFNHEGGADT